MRDKIPWAVTAGERFGRLVAVRLASVGANQKEQWLCHCDCGRESLFRAVQLRTAKSCGCCPVVPGRKPGFGAFPAVRSQSEPRGRGRPPGPSILHQIRDAEIRAMFATGSFTYEAIGEFFGLTRQRVQQIVTRVYPDAASEISPQ